MTGPRFTWDPRKAAANHRKHGVAFPEAVSVFSDERGLLLDDPAHSSADEDRFVLIGLSRAPRVLVVVHCYRAADEEIRLISARRATPRERQAYVRGWAPER